MRHHKGPAQSAGLVIVGGGIMGLWAAYWAEKAGIDTLLLDGAPLGNGASNGLLGALMAYMPDQWDEKKQFQFESLVELEHCIAVLEEETGRTSGYRRSGRVMPVRSERHLETALIRSQQAKTNWRLGERQFRWDVSDLPPVSDWPRHGDGVLAYVHEDFAAHIFPRSFVGLLSTFLRTARHVRIDETARVCGIDPADRTLRLADGRTIGFGKVIVAAGVGAFSLLQPLWVPEGKPLGRPVKGQGALLAADCDPALPIMFDDGLYVIAHEGGRVAIGSTSEDAFSSEHETDDRLEALIAAARLAVPELADAPVIERWAGLRPRGVHREPMIGHIDDCADVIALGGGFKTSFGIAHRLARHAVATACQIDAYVEKLPSIFDISIYLSRAK